MLLLRLIQAALLAAAVTAATAPSPNSTSPIQEPDWASIVPSRELEYHDCYNGLKCARLSVPLDWRNASDNRLTHIAMVKLPAAVPDDDATFGGTVIINPGGPGLSGVSYLVERGANVQKLLVDIPGTRHYEVVSFDPRGIGRTTPTVNCFRSNELTRMAWTLENHAKGPLSSGPAISYGLGLWRFHYSRCQQEDSMRGPDEEAMKFVNTPSVARDMVEIVDKIDELRKREAAKMQKPPQKKSEDKNPTVARIQYIGWSYGSILGNYFASMFPGRVGRMVLDGVMDPRDYATGSGWVSNTQDADKLLEEFWKTCYAAGARLCPFYKTDNNWKAAQQRFYKWVSHLDDYPAATKSPSGGLLALRGEDVRRIVANALYSPLQHFRPLALALYEGMKGNPTRLFKWTDAEMSKMEDAARRGTQNVSTTTPAAVKEEQVMAVLCTDGQDISGRQVDFWQDNVSDQRKQSKLLGYLWAAIRFSCSAWQLRPSWEFRGPFRSPAHSVNLETDRPAAPLLFLSTLLDPVTPLRVAKLAAKSHVGSVVVTQKSLGHTAWGSAPSKCTWTIVSKYLLTGVMPETGTVCEEDCGPWDEKCNAFEVAQKFDVDERAWRAMFDAKEPSRLRQVPLGLE